MEVGRSSVRDEDHHIHTRFSGTGLHRSVKELYTVWLWVSRLVFATPLILAFDVEYLDGTACLGGSLAHIGLLSRALMGIFGIQA